MHQFREFRPKTKVTEAKAASVQREWGIRVSWWQVHLGHERAIPRDQRGHSHLPQEKMDRTSCRWKPEQCWRKESPTSPFVYSGFIFSSAETKPTFPLHGCPCYAPTHTLYSCSAWPLQSLHRRLQRPLFSMNDQEQSPFSCSSPPSPGRCLSLWSRHQSHLGCLLNYRPQGHTAAGFWFTGTKLEPDHILPFQQASRWFWSAGMWAKSSVALVRSKMSDLWVFKIEAMLIYSSTSQQVTSHN